MNNEQTTSTNIQPTVSRRSLIKGSALLALGAAATGLMGCSSEPKAEAVPGVPESWDIETDILVLGCGGAGLAAAITARMESDLDVIVVEAAPAEEAGGNTRVSGNTFILPDTPEQAAAYQTELNANYRVEAELIDAWAQNLFDNRAWIEDLGLELHQEKFASPEFPGVEGGEGVITYTIGGVIGNASLWAPLLEIAEELETTIMYDTRATELFFDPITHEVYGALAGDKKIKARKGVIMALGGFAANSEMMNQYYCGLGSETFFVGSPYNVGDGHKMTAKLNVDMWHMNNFAGNAICARSVSKDENISAGVTFDGKDYIYVDGEAKRFMYEETNGLHRHGKMKEKGVWPMVTVPSGSFAIFGQQSFGGGLSIQRIDSMGWAGIMGTKPGTDNQAYLDAGIIVKADTIEELAEKTGLTAEALKETIETYNAACAAGVDEEFGRGGEVYDTYSFSPESEDTLISTEATVAIASFDLVPIEAPYYAVAIAHGILNTQGGPKRNGKAQVLGIDGNAVPRLYSAGEFGSIYPYMYNGGGNVSEAIAYGRVAARECIALDSWDAQ